MTFLLLDIGLRFSNYRQMIMVFHNNEREYFLLESTKRYLMKMLNLYFQNLLMVWG